ncbi:MAG: OmpA family protein [Sulfitobacter sp.]
MSFIKSNLSWMVPAAAITAVSVGIVGRDNMEPSAADVVEGVVETVASVPVNADPETASRVDRLNASVLAALNTPDLNATPAAVAAPSAEPVQQEGAAVTRNAPLDLLTPLAQEVEQAAFVATPQPAPQQQEDITQENAADFFNNAQNNLAVANACGDDLRALAEQTQVYFPTGAASGDEEGLNAARLIGLVAQDCPGFSIQVEGHSDASGDPVTNQRLSEKRAQAVISRLGASGVDTSDFFAVGLGDTQPSNVRGPKGAAYYDRRVEFSIIESVQRVSFTTRPQTWNAAVPSCAADLDHQASQMRQFYSPGAITVSTTDLQAVYNLAEQVSRCDGARLRLVGQHEDEVGSREGPITGRLRALAMMSTLVSAGYPSDQILIGAPSWSIDVPNNPSLPNNRLDFQVIAD